jgi:hypothetical protein
MKETYFLENTDWKAAELYMSGFINIDKFSMSAKNNALHPVFVALKNEYTS